MDVYHTIQWLRNEIQYKKSVIKKVNDEMEKNLLIINGIKTQRQKLMNELQTFDSQESELIDEISSQMKTIETLSKNCDEMCDKLAEIDAFIVYSETRGASLSSNSFETPLTHEATHSHHDIDVYHSLDTKRRPKLIEWTDGGRQVCEICGHRHPKRQTNGHFGCESCRLFNSRYLRKNTIIVCKKSNQCLIDYKSLKVSCESCRAYLCAIVFTAPDPQDK